MAIDNNPPDVKTNDLVKKEINTWRAGGDPDAESFLELHPHVRDHHALVLDLAYEEYCLRRDAGEQVVVSTFCDRFPTVKKSLRKLLGAHEVFEDIGGLDLGIEEIPWPETESLFLGFYLVRELGRGAFARVYLATEPSLGDRLVVVKISLRGGGEAETLGRLAHRNIVPVYSVQEDPDTQLTAICMPYLGSGTLLKALSAAYDEDRDSRDADLFIDIGNRDSIPNAIPDDQVVPDRVLQHVSFHDGVVHIMAQIADALAYTHAAGICHRDLKPSNILLAPSGRPLLLDFNLSSDERQQRTLVGGTLPYMPPEQLHTVLVEGSDDAHLGDPRSDVFSLGVIFYELLTGKLPFGDQDPQEDVSVAALRLLTRQEEGFPPLDSAANQVDPEVREIVQRCLRLEPEERYQNAADLAGALHARLSKAARLKRWMHRRRFLLAAAAVGSGALAGAVGFKIVTRPPLAVRQYQAGIDAFEKGSWDEAVECFSDAADARPNAFQPLLARGQARVAKGDFERAGADFEESYLRNASGLTAYWAGYAFQLARRHDTPVKYFYRRAIEEHGYQAAGVWNNYGYFLRTRDPKVAFDWLSRAIAIDEDCQPAYLNRAYVCSILQNSAEPDDMSFVDLALQDAEAATKLEPYKAHAYFSAAMIHWRHNWTPRRRQVIVDNLGYALDHGYDKQKLLDNSGFEREFTDPLRNHESNSIPTAPNPNLLLVPPPHWFPELEVE